MKRKYLLVGIGVVLILPLVFLFQPKEFHGHQVNLDTSGKSPLVKRIKIIQQNGARPRFSPDGKLIVFDRKNEDGFYDLYLSDLEGKIIRDLTIAKSGMSSRAVLPQHNNANAVFHPSVTTLFLFRKKKGMLKVATMNGANGELRWQSSLLKMMNQELRMNV